MGITVRTGPDDSDTLTGINVRAKEFRYAASVDRLGNASTEAGAPLELGDEWTPEHLVLAGLVNCSLTSLRHHAARAGIEVLASGSATGLVTRREEDGRYAFVELEVEIAAELEPEPAELDELLAKAERDCFVGASLTSKPVYRWTINGASPR